MSPGSRHARRWGDGPVRTALLYTAGLVAIYLLVSHATEAGKLLGAGASGYALGVKTLQGR